VVAITNSFLLAQAEVDNSQQAIAAKMSVARIIKLSLDLIDCDLIHKIAITIKITRKAFGTKIFFVNQQDLAGVITLLKSEYYH
jgi:hypothetical protein